MCTDICQTHAGFYDYSVAWLRFDCIFKSILDQKLFLDLRNTKMGGNRPPPTAEQQAQPVLNATDIPEQVRATILYFSSIINI